MNADPKNVVNRLRVKFEDDGTAGSWLPNEAADLIEILAKQRDELLAALNRIMALPEKHPQDPIACVNETHLIAECAIASAKGGA